MTLENLRQRMKNLPYPGNQYYDVETFKPHGEAVERVRLAKTNMPELEAGGESLLDIGSNKGFVCFHYRNRFKKIVGYEIAPHYYQFAEDVREYHNIENIKFVHGEFRDVFINKRSPHYTEDCRAIKKYPVLRKYLNVHTGKFDVVYCGSVHHHFYKDALLYGAPPFLWCKKLIALAKKYIILDGPFDMNDGSLKVFAKEGKWTDEQRGAFSLKNIEDALKPKFILKRINASERNRWTVVFERCQCDIVYMENDTIQNQIKEKGVALECNTARPKGSMYRIGDKRVKYDPGLQSDGIYQILNSMPEYFMKTWRVIVNEKKERIGDVSEWIDGPHLGPEDHEELYQNFLKMNAALTSIGLIEPHFKRTDYKRRGDNIINVDVDMIRIMYHHMPEHIEKWTKNRIAVYPERKKQFEYMAKNWRKKSLYWELMNE